MNAIERKRYILDELQRNGSVVITDLAERIQVSSMTIRRDLNAMAEDGMVTLEHGGAVLNSGSLFECSISFKMRSMCPKSSASRPSVWSTSTKAIPFFLDAGTTPNELAGAAARQTQHQCTDPLSAGSQHHRYHAEHQASSCVRASSVRTPWLFWGR